MGKGMKSNTVRKGEKQETEERMMKNWVKNEQVEKKKQKKIEEGNKKGKRRETSMNEKEKKWIYGREKSRSNTVAEGRTGKRGKNERK